MNYIYEFIREQIQTNQFFSAAFFATIIGGVIVYLKSVPGDIYKYLRRQVVYRVDIPQNDPLFYSFEVWFFTHHSNRYKEVEASSFERISIYGEPTVDGSDIPQKVYYRQNSGYFFIKYNGKNLLVEKNKSRLDGAKDIASLFLNTYSISGIYAREVIDSLLNECLSIQNRSNFSQEVRLFNNTPFGDWSFSGVIKSKTIDNVYIDQKSIYDLKRDIDEFLEDRDWYNRASILYKRGYCLEGPPGNGKSSLAYAIADYTKRNVYNLDLSIFENGSNLTRCIDGIGVKSILLVEDIDRVIDKNKNMLAQINLGSFLNILDGGNYKDGLITIITTNHISRLDPAMLRPGRIDFKISIPVPKQKDVKRYLAAFYGIPVDLKEGENTMAMCDIQRVCMSNKFNPDVAVIEIESNYSLKKEHNEQVC